MSENDIGVVLFANRPLGKTRTESFPPKNPHLGLIPPLKAPKTGVFNVPDRSRFNKFTQQSLASLQPLPLHHSLLTQQSLSLATRSKP